MTVSDDFIPGGDTAYDAGPNYPVVFGITLTPVVSGVLLALVGLGAAAYLLVNLVQPEWQKYQELQVRVKEKNDQVAQRETILKQIEKSKADLEAARRQRADVLALFANESTLDTLLLDLNRQIETRSAGLTRARQDKLAACPARVRQNVREFESQVGPLVAKPQLKRFVPEAEAKIITDNSYGALVNNKLKRQIVAVEFEGNFNQTQAILRSIERLQPLLVFKNLESTLGTTQGRTGGRYFEIQGNTIRLVPNCQPEATITTKFQLEALLPLTPEEAAKVSTPAPPPKP